MGEVVVTVTFVLFFFKQKTADEMLRSVVGSEMCIRDRVYKIGFVALVAEILEPKF